MWSESRRVGRTAERVGKKDKTLIEKKAEVGGF